MTSPDAPSFHRTLRVLVSALMAAPVLFVVVGATILEDGFTDPPWWMLGVVAGEAAVILVLLQLVGLRTVPAIVPGTPEEDARRFSATALQSNVILRFALCESIALVALALSFVAESGGLVVLVLGVALCEALMALFVWPGDKLVASVQGALEREGGVSHLQAALDGPPPTPGA